MSELEKKVDELKVIAEKKACSNEELVKTMRMLNGVKEEMLKAKAEYAELKEKCAKLEQENAELKDTVESRDYQIVILSRNLRHYLDLEDAKQ